MNNFLLLVLLLVISEYPLSSSTPDLFYRGCSNQFRCGKMVVDFPFWGGKQRPRECGHPGLELQCENDTAFIKIDGVRYRVLDIDLPYNHKKMRIAREDYKGGLCPQNIQNTTLDSTLLVSSPDYRPLTLLYDCPSFIPSPFPFVLANFSCHNVFNSSNGLITLGDTGTMNCSASATVLVPKSFSTGEGIKQALKDGFEVELKVDDKACQKCLDSKGKCGIGFDNQTVCYCLGSSTSLAECPPPPANMPATISLPALPPAAANKSGKYLYLKLQVAVTLLPLYCSFATTTPTLLLGVKAAENKKLPKNLEAICSSLYFGFDLLLLPRPSSLADQLLLQCCSFILPTFAVLTNFWSCAELFSSFAVNFQPHCCHFMAVSFHHFCSEIYFPSWIYKQIEKAEELNLDRVVNDDEEEEMIRKMVIVSLWCIQTIPSNRPSMTKVLEMLQGSLEALPLPPEPLLSSPGPAVRSPKNSSTTSSVTMQVRLYSAIISNYLKLFI
ncbi:hypothetical protein SLEP1_g10728 [Rubroshorea leprosula]|uniref:non-specific serine/threonine protein kinase n=1 Tax=Rubroshorea leprosula TaxID=152421 RepID=A0AAV5IDG7_9ROSI|nr:hypothetical protein SLEP1_g10728 [Rubroshorea leprosula]